SMEFERILSASGPTMGHLTRPSDHKEPKKIAFLQCVGSRDTNHCNHAYCSSVCCMYAIKESVIAKEHSKNGLDVAIFYMDMRTHGKDFERYYNSAKDKHGVRFIRSRVHTIDPVPGSDDLKIAYADNVGEIHEEEFDLVVLSVGLETSTDQLELAKMFNLNLSASEFCETSSFAPTSSSKPGVYVCGAFQGPKDIPQSVMEASASAAAAGIALSPARSSLTKVRENITERDMRGEKPRIGVFVCHCGINIAGVVDVAAVRDYVKTLPYVAYAETNLYSCSQDTQDLLAKVIKEQNLNRVVVAACTPRTHEPLFQETLAQAGINKYLFEMANIRNQDSWIHGNDPVRATEKAKDLVRMAVAKVALLEPVKDTELPVNQNALVLGGGLAGMNAAKTLADSGLRVHLVEKSERLGGQALNLYKTWKGENIQEELAGTIKSIEQNPNIKVYLNSELTNVDGFVGNFKSMIKTSGNPEELLEHGVAVLATGGEEYRPTEYLYGQHDRVMTSLELDRLFIQDDPKLNDVKTAVFIQCVGSREPARPYCSRVCCTHSIESALQLKKRNPNTNVFIIYRDIRSYGERELVYKEARAQGVIFIRYDQENKPQVTAGTDGVDITVIDHVLGRPITLKADLLTLASAILPHKVDDVSQFFKVPVNADGFFIEAHAKLRPVEFATDGVFLCGLGHYPKPIDESIAQAQAAVSRAITLLSQKTVQVSGQVAQVDAFCCSSCGICVSICPYSAPGFNEKTAKAEINPALCKGCGLCVASCRSGALHLKGFDTGQIFAQIEA
ncbi:MAG: CoB--CoM heterodisulfide reductase iron-sulfur subunit A family protein, partial [Deltaproteobacteria bacterium]|nr:CoB--CoM heterodisulfide reductase iron-sulfur subunit A family protein [Deltaproteobacteria bacterium]